MKNNRVLILGGGGFIGRSVAEQLSRNGNVFITVPTRRRDRVKHLLVLPACDVVDADINDTDTLKSLIASSDVVINLVGILHGDFQAMHVEFPKRVAELCVLSGVSRLIHMSALNADPNGPSEYLRSRGRGEAEVLAIAAQNPQLHITVFRPSVVFGEHDHFLNLFATLVKYSPVIPLGTFRAQFQPIWVEDVARAMVASITNTQTFGQTYELGGPDVFTLQQLLEFVIHKLAKPRVIIGLGALLSNIQAAVFEHLPGKLITRDNVLSMSVPSVCKEEFPAVFNFKRSTMESVVSRYLGSQPAQSPYNVLRDRAGR